MRYRATVSYFGKNYVGWQRQLNGLSVQEVLENALTKTFGIPTSCTASGRTDAGVHALGQVIHFDADTSIPTDKIPYAVNTSLPDDVSMLYCEETYPEFNARFSAKRKTYRYSIYTSPHRLPVIGETHSHVISPLDADKMKECAKILVGEHDFKCFEASGSVVKSTVRTIYSLDVEVKDIAVAGKLAFRPQEITITVCGNGFLYNMVRIIAGTLTYVGMGKLTADDVKLALESKDRTKAGKTLPPEGLCLLSVEYED